MITSTANSRVKHIRALQAKRHARNDSQEFVIEGSRLAQEAILAKSPVEFVLHTDPLDEDETTLVKGLAELGGKVLVASDKVIGACSAVESPQNIIAVLPYPSLPIPSNRTLNLLIDRVSDPGNLGTILRTALAAGVDLVILTDSSADPYNPKVVRGAMGAQLRLPIVSCPMPGLPAYIENTEVILADAYQGEPYYEVDWTRAVTLVVGSEAHGIHSDIEALGSKRSTIPMRGDFDSLNAAVATGVLLFEIVRQRGNA